MKKLALFALILTLLAGCAPQKPTPDTKVINLATTTSTQDSGLLDYLLPKFSEETGYEVKVIAVGTGAAIKLGENGEADILLVHSRPDEDKFISDGHGTKRYNVMYNDFILVGSDEALALNSKDTTTAFLEISQNELPFVSRGDDSGTHKKELSIWKKTGITPNGKWYYSVGKGMGDTLLMTDELKGFTLSDRATYLSMKDKLALSIKIEGDSTLLNEYGILIVNKNKNDKINEKGATALAEWLIGKKGQQLIGEFGKDKYGYQLFFPKTK